MMHWHVGFSLPDSSPIAGSAGPFLNPAVLRSCSSTDAMTSWNSAMSATSFKDVPPTSPVPVA
jgi:hypothetical protein